MKLTKRLMALLTMVLAVWFIAGCEEAAEKALEEATGLDWELSEDTFVEDTGVETPYNWTFMFAVDLDADQASLIDESFEVDLSLLKDAGFDLSEIEYQVIMGHATKTNGGDKPGLRYANKILVANNVLKLDGESIEKLGSSVGASGAGWYVAYFSLSAVGFVKGTVTDCDGAVPQGDQILVTASDGPFFTYAAADDGSWALPSIDGKPASVGFDAGDCSGQTTDPVTDPETDPPPPGKCEDAPEGCDIPPNDPLDDGTNIIDDGETDLDDEGNPPPGEPSEGTRFEFTDEDSAMWDATGDCYAWETGDYATLFPGGGDGNYGLLSSGWNGIANKQSCTISRTFTVPADASTMAVAYDFISQEYSEWVGSAYNDILTVQIQGAFDYVVHRTINGENNWENLGLALGWIDNSPDAQYNSPAYIFDGHLVWDGDDSMRGNNDSNLAQGRVAEYEVTGGATITVLITVSDVADAIYDSAAALDYIEFK